MGEALAAPRIVHNRVDAMYLAFRVSLSERTQKEIVRAAELASVHGYCRATIAGVDWQFKHSQGRSIIRCEEFMRGMIDPKAPGSVMLPTVNGLGEQTTEHEAGWTVALEIYASHIAEVGPERAYAEARLIAQKMGKVHEARLRRLDLACDVQRWELHDRDRRALVRRSRVKTRTDPPRPRGDVLATAARDGLDLAGLAAMHEANACTVTGFTVGKGDVMCRIYDKQEELSCMSPHKKDAEQERWRRGGWDGEAPVTRVEFQLRGDVMRELGLRAIECIHDPTTGEYYETLSEYLPRVWATCTKWVRLIRRTQTRSGKAVPLTRCPLDPRWQALSATSWGNADPIYRKRERGGASSSQALGSMLSVAAARGKLSCDMPESREAFRVSPVERLQAMLAAIASWSVDLIAVDMIERWGSAEDACAHVAILWNGARGRFSRITHEHGPPLTHTESSSCPPISSQAFLELAPSRDPSNTD